MTDTSSNSSVSEIEDSDLDGSSVCGGQRLPIFGRKDELKPQSTATTRQLRRRDPSDRVDYNVENHYLALEAALEPANDEEERPSIKREHRQDTIRMGSLKRGAWQPAASKNLGNSNKRRKRADVPQDKPEDGQKKDRDEGAQDRAGESRAVVVLDCAGPRFSSAPLQHTPTRAHALGTRPRIFNRSLPDLFTYGLKLDDSVLPDINVDGQALPNPGFLSTAISDNLQLLVCHPVWEGSLSLVRYALQVAVMHRVPGHIFPIAPLPNLTSRVTVMRNPSLAGHPMLARDFDFASYEMSHPCARPMIQQLCDILEESVEKEDFHEADAGFREKTLFLLRVQDIQAVINSTNRLAVNGMPVFRTCHDYFLHHKSLAQAERDHRASIDELEALKRHKKEWVLATRRKWIVSSRHWRQESTGVAPPAEDEPGAYDMPEGDACPAHLYCEQLGRSEAHLALMRGTIWPLIKTPPPVFGL
ncbi:hypothetical protein MYCTH_2129714 [Thermothelomyces thermophilus ATCC 42464]|uniref:Uncharacterized protein n=1 Tax=Thermothelomyces thermophilus (strain ATCC 42464 / BCRC 31852 / DSM 1799) TaxID=573729 RepID=G2QKX4_THET4|nr:uncharacterized protein MYCTH_2129714 [Thermothelomyces thermophilus ATCC 42464]AEO60606.1 hypothetical protein MYCTH_2129714 [Thermothelomyces thermophilus ATCC 42464]